MTAYSTAVWQRFLAPAYAGTLAPPGVRTGQVEAPGGDAELALDLRVRESVITETAFRVYGCPASVAAADWLCERIRGDSARSAAEVGASTIEDALELAPEKRVCGLLAIDALAAALAAGVTVGESKTDAEVRL